MKVLSAERGLRPIDQPLEVGVDEERVDAIFSHIDQCQLPGAAVGIAVRGRPVYRKGFGLANMERPVVLSPATRLRIGSTSKHLTCFAYMLMCEEGKADIDDPVGKFIPELHPVAKGVTMRQLMANTSGLRDAYDIYFQFSGFGSPALTKQLLELYCEIDDVNAAPGTTWSYNNGGWLLITEVIERISGMSFEDVMRQKVFDAVGMYDTLVRRSDTDFTSNSGAQHATRAAGGFERRVWGLDNFVGAGAVVSTVDDMLRWMANMDTRYVGSMATWASMTTPQRLANGTATGYGLGLFLDQYQGVSTIYHAGNALGGSAQMLKVPAAELDIVVLSNRQDIYAPGLADQVRDACIPSMKGIDDSSKRVRTTGIYKSPTTGRVIRLFEKAGKQIASIYGADFPVEPDDKGVLRCVNLWRDSKQTITLVGDQAHPRAVLYNDFGDVDELQKAESAVAIPDTSGLVGTYRCGKMDARATVFNTKDGLRMTTVGRFGTATHSLECLAKSVWQARQVGPMPFAATVAFQDDGSAFALSTWQMAPVNFCRCR